MLPGMSHAGPIPYNWSLRVEHWTNAVEQAALVAFNLLSSGSPQRYQAIPYFLSDQFGTKIQCLGRIPPDDNVAVIDGARPSGR
jgi:3-phenylpropionate/trans-cinnamate dioxygenase ferredoxin reductase component